jgi:hypothetical protein
VGHLATATIDPHAKPTRMPISVAGTQSLAAIDLEVFD